MKQQKMFWRFKAQVMIMVEKKKEGEAKTASSGFNPWSVIEHPLLTEKAIGLVETQNKLVFAVRRSANKKQIASAVEKAFSVKVDAVQTFIDRKGRKRAFVKLAKEFAAADIATKLGML